MPADYLPEPVARPGRVVCRVVGRWCVAWLAGGVSRGWPVVCRVVGRSPAWFPDGSRQVSRVVPRFRFGLGFG